MSARAMSGTGARCAASLVWLPLVLASLSACSGSGAGGAALASPATKPTQAPSCSVTYVANAGFLVETPGHRVLLDALFGPFEGEWCQQPHEATRGALLAGEDPFEGIDAVTISHAHVDHFDADLVAAFCLRHPGTPVLCPPQVEARLRQHAGYPAFGDALVVLSLEPGQRSTIRLGALEVDAWRLPHGSYLETDERTGQRRDRHRDVENLAFVLRVDGFTVLHSGDAGAEGLSGCSERPGWPQRIDLALLGRSLASDVHAPGIDVIADELRPRHVVLTHVEPGAAPRYRAVAARLAGRIADLTVLEHPLDRFTFRAGDGRAR
jgi:L-ascorbate metabolism protein UlaG (beta-lactamase superfamily)